MQIRSGPATVSAEERSEYATGAAQRWEGSFDPKKREPGDRLSSRRFESASKERSITIPELDQSLRLVYWISRWICLPVQF